MNAYRENSDRTKAVGPKSPTGFAVIVFLRIFQIGLHTFGILAVGIIKMLPVLR